MLKETKENEELKSVETVTKFIKDEVEDCINGFYFIVDVDVDDDGDGDGGGDGGGGDDDDHDGEALW